MERKVVAKFGGTSVKTAEAIRKLADIVKLNLDIKVIVVSAVGGATNLLVQLCHCENEQFNDLIEDITNIHIKLSHDLGLSIYNKIVKSINRLLNIPSDYGDDEKMDYILSLGEELSSSIIYSFLKSQNINIDYVDIRDYLITDNHFGKANPDIKEIGKRFESFPKGLSITQGFIGSESNGKTTTLGRGGSDYSAALIAEAFKADELLIYTDVPGVYTMDPNVIKSAHLIDELSFQEMAEMANFGAKILHPATLEPCVRAKIYVRILSTFESDKKGTLINIKDTNTKNQHVRAITTRKNQVLVTIKSLKMLNAYGFLANIFSILSKHKISVDLITTSEVSVALTIDGTSLGSHGLNPFINNKILISELKEFADISIEEDLTLIAVIGSGLTVTGAIQKTLTIIESYMIRLVCYGASNSSIGILVNKNDANNMAQELHQHLLLDYEN